MKFTKDKSRLLLWQTIKSARPNLPQAILICGVIFVPVSIYRAFNTTPNVSLAYTFLMYVLNLVGFLLAFRMVDYTKGLRQNLNHFISTAALKLPQFFAVSLVQLLSGLPLFLGLFLLLTAVSIGKAGWWLVILGILALAFATIISIRLSLASILVVEKDITSIAALRISYRLTRKNFWRTLWLLTIYFFTAIFFSTIIFIIVGLIPKVAQNNLASGAVGGLLLSVMVPVYGYYLSVIVKYYEKKSGT